MRFGARQVLVGIVASALLAAAASPARAACDGNTAGVSVCSGSDAAISKTATGNLDVQFNNQTVTTGGVTISGGAGSFNVDLNVTSASGPNPITNNTGAGSAIDISSTGGNVAVTTIAGAPVTSNGNNGIFASTTTGAITINTGAVTTNSTGMGINATTAGGGISITTNGVVQSTGGNGINTLVTGGSGNTAITFNADVLYGSSTAVGIQAVSSSTGSMTISGSGNITKAGAGTGGAIILTNTAATTSGNLTINTSGNFDNFIAASVTQAGNNANISVTHTGTLSSVNVDALTATTAGGGNISITTTNLVQTSGALETIRASTTTGAITINTGAVTTNSTGMGINATTTGGGISITNNGTVTSTGGIAINAAVNGGSGGIAITTNAAVNSQNGGIDAVVAHITGGGTGNIIVNVNAAVTATGNAINLLGGITNTVTNNSTISGALDGIFADHVNVTNAGQITGTTGILTTLGGSIVFDTGTITGTGGTAVQFGAPGNTFTLGPGFTVNGLVRAFAGDAFQLGGTGTASFDASLIGPAAQYRGFTIFNKVSDSTWTLTGSNALVLPWTVQQGTLNVTGSLPNSPFTVQNGTLSVDGTVGAVTMNGGVLNGIGTLGGLTVNGGIVAPGHSIGTLNVNGNVSFGAGSTYQVEANAAGQSDKIAGTGTATLTGGTVQALAAPGAYSASTTYTILTANGGRTGTFTNVTSSLPFLIPSLSYDANDVFLTLTRNATFLQSQGSTRNQVAVGSALDRFPTNNSLFLSVAALNGTAAIRQAFDALSGEVHADLQNSLIDDSRYVRQSVLGRLRQAPYEGAADATSALGYSGLAFAYRGDSPDALAYADPKSPKVPFPVKAPIAAPLAAPTTTFWATGYGAWGRTDSDGNAASLRRDLAGFLVGADRRVDNWWAGLAAGYSHDWIRVPDRASSAEVDSGHVAGYVGAAFGALNLRGGAAYAFHNIDTSRSIVFPGFSDTARASYHGGTAQAFGEIGYAVATGAVAWEPFGGLAWVHLNTQSFAEAGGAAALNGGGSDRGVGYSTLGLRVATVYALANGARLVPRITAAWQHTIGNVTPDIGLTFQSVAAPFAITGVPLARDGALVEAGADLRINPWTSFGLYYNGFLAGDARDHAVRGKFSMAF
jgi:outer membrane autotransporter protein